MQININESHNCEGSCELNLQNSFNRNKEKSHTESKTSH